MGNSEHARVRCILRVSDRILYHWAAENNASEQIDDLLSYWMECHYKDPRLGDKHNLDEIGTVIKRYMSWAERYAARLDISLSSVSLKEMA